VSKLLFNDQIFVSTYVGPVRADGGPRKRVQIMSRDPANASGRVDDKMLSLSMAEWTALRRAVDQLGPDCDGPEL
jgi:hypothetical protein